jgi:hypothetical protein
MVDLNFYIEMQNVLIPGREKQDNLLSVNLSEHFSNTLPNLDDIILGSLCVYSIAQIFKF